LYAAWPAVNIAQVTLKSDSGLHVMYSTYTALHEKKRVYLDAKQQILAIITGNFNLQMVALLGLLHRE